MTGFYQGGNTRSISVSPHSDRSEIGEIAIEGGEIPVVTTPTVRHMDMCMHMHMNMHMDMDMDMDMDMEWSCSITPHHSHLHPHLIHISSTPHSHLDPPRLLDSQGGGEQAHCGTERPMPLKCEVSCGPARVYTPQRTCHPQGGSPQARKADDRKRW